MESFLDFYDLYRSTNDITDFFAKNQTNKTCRFCRKSVPDASFNTIPHIIPELFGRNNVTSNFECDDCNKKFQKFETDASTMIQHYLTLLKIKTKKGVPMFQSKKDKEEYSTTLKYVSNSLSLNFGRNLSDFEYNDQENKLIINFRTKRFSPFSVYKIFLKMSISLLTDTDLINNPHYIEFLNSDTPIDNGMQVWTVFRYMLKTKYHLTPTVNLYKAKSTLLKNNAFPEFVLLINFSNIVFQFFLPVSNKNIREHSKENTLRAELFPTFVLEDITKLETVELYCMDLKKTEKVSITDRIVMYYEQCESQITSSL